ncbi:hypothetical protein EJ04DRAFT_566809 [Polyplosphaeria fusca]|uniref:Uncharacterized protein n=1 Tax=Polyplosphaeria fusca TaxID=682080 RepID=A0A9P4QUX0_9PLEO|nr:hypothetical protein EJ04DRAFT_566809 [Polyplosphaeria fusca]
MNLAKDCKNISLWEAALRIQVVGKAAKDILEEASAPPKPSKPIYQDLPPRPDDTEPQAQKDYRDYVEKEAFIKSILLATVNQEFLEGLREHKKASSLFNGILKHYKD